MSRYNWSKILLLAALLTAMFVLLYINNTNANRFTSTEDKGYFGEEVTGDIPRLVYVEGREGLDSDISSTNSDRMFNQAYVDQYEDSRILSKKAKLREFTSGKNTATAVIEFDNGSILNIEYSENPRYVGNIEISTKIIKSARKGDNS
jgi:hypothetical protein